MKRTLNEDESGWYDKKQRPTNIYCEDLSPTYSLAQINHCDIDYKDLSQWTDKEYACECPPCTKKVSHMFNGNKSFKCEPIPNLPKPTPSPVK